jgi:alpha-beta hydrolase superfamily lysophospholipase
VRPEYDDTMYSKPIDGVTLTEKTIVLNGRKINCNRWTPKGPPKGLVVVSHGLHEHGQRYYSLAAVLAKKNYIVIACDHSSHGLSDGVRGLITDYRMLPMDFVSLCTVSHEEFPELPCFIVSHSMGTLVAIMAIGELPFVKVKDC